VSLCQTAFAAVGGVAFVHAAAQWGFPWFIALVFSGIVAAAIGLIVAVPAIRVSGVFLALATLGFGLALQSLFYPTNLMFTKSVTGLPNIPRPSFAHTDKAVYYLILAAAVLVSLLMVAIQHGRLGRLLRGLADSPLALNTMGSSVNASRVIVFCISAFVAGIAGALYGTYFQGIGLETPLFQPVLSLQLFAIVMLIAAGTPWYGLMGAIGLQVFPSYLSEWLPNVNVQSYVSWVFGLSAVAIAIQADRRPAAPKWFQRFAERFRTRTPAGAIAALVAAAPPRVRPEGQGLEVEELIVEYGGVAAVSSLSLHSPFGRITGLIGPNGAGKTTTFNACTGLVRPSGGLVRYNSRLMSDLSPAARARLGIGRTYQTPELWDSLSVRENVELGAEAPIAGSNHLAQLAAKRKERTDIQAAAAQAMDLAGILDLADRRVGDLSTGQRRIVELARVLAGPFDLLLLDEPSSGLDKEETDRFGALLRRVVRDRGIGILLVEHDMQLVMAICQYIYVMDFGHKIFEGTPYEVENSPIVRTAYLGTEEIEVLDARESAAEVLAEQQQA
jgi:ABC-type branched-subunit amino acid transport system ATPase component/ABC-type branched-subunit amino acid transport system permease subunit